MTMNKLTIKGRPLRILVTNDDGIHADGLVSLEKIARELSDDVWIVAPEREKSGASRSISLADPIRMRPLDERRYAVMGTPADCVLMGLHQVMPEPPDLVLSGVNRGQNIAEDVTYSGTVAAAMEGSGFGIRSIALSQAYGIETEGRAAIPLDVAEAHGAGIVRKIVAGGSRDNLLTNVNFPDCRPHEVCGIAITHQGQRDKHLLTIEPRTDRRANDYYWIGFRHERSNPADGTDLHAIYNRKISITPLHTNLTHHGELDAVRAAFDNVE